MESKKFDEPHVLEHLRHYLPTQSPLKDFVHHNTLHAFQHDAFHKALHTASEIFGYRTYLGLDDYRKRYADKKINPDILKQVIANRKGSASVDEWMNILLHKDIDGTVIQRVGSWKKEWQKVYHINVEKAVHATLFNLVSGYLDQGISLQPMPPHEDGFLASVRQLETHSYISLFKKPRARQLLLNGDCSLQGLLHLLVGDEALYERYLFDQQFAHPGWSGMVSVLEGSPHTLLDPKKITLSDFICLELLLEIDVFDTRLGENWKKIGLRCPPAHNDYTHLFAPVKASEYFEASSLWQEAMEWTFYDQVLQGVKTANQHKKPSVVQANHQPSFQAMFCMDDRECSIRRNVESVDKNAETFGTPGFFNVEFFFQPEYGKFYTKLCPAPVTPKYLIQEKEAGVRHTKDVHFASEAQGFFTGWLISQTIGFWSGLKLLFSIFKPTETPAAVSSFKHMDKDGKIGIECDDPAHNKINDLQVGFTLVEMADRMEGLLKSIGLVENFAPIVYVIGHGASSVNNTHYAGYDCGACSGRAGSVNARVCAYAANHPEVRALLAKRGIHIPADTQFLPALHDTTKDEIYFYDEKTLNSQNATQHPLHKKAFLQALDINARERSRRFLLMDSNERLDILHEKVRLRALSLFEPRPEWNHATNALCIVGRRSLSKYLFLDRRSFLNSYDYRVDKDGKYLLAILRAVAPVAGGINLEYYFSRVDNYRLGAGTKLSHNVVGLIGVANGMGGDLRTGLPKQMINIHDPLRLLVMVEQFPDKILQTLQQHTETYEWFLHEWIHLVSVNPEDYSLQRFHQGKFHAYSPTLPVEQAKDIARIVTTAHDNLPIYIIN